MHIGDDGVLARVWEVAALTEGRRWLAGGGSVVEGFKEWSSSRCPACRGWGAHIEAKIVEDLPGRDRSWRWLGLDLVTTK
jgi:hypothetical protein